MPNAFDLATGNPIPVRAAHPVDEGEPTETPERGPLSRYSLALESAPTNPPGPSLPDDLSVVGLAGWILEGSVPVQMVPRDRQAALLTLMKDIRKELIERNDFLQDLHTNLEKGELR